MPSKPKISRREYSDEIVGIILALCEAGKLYAQIADQVKISRLCIVYIIHRATRIQNEPYHPTKRASCLPQLDTQARQALIRHVERNLNGNLAALDTPSKSDTTLSRKIVRVYLKAVGYLQFKAQRKSYLTKKHKEARLGWTRGYLGWTLENCKEII